MAGRLEMTGRTLERGDREVGKAEALKTSISEHDARRVVHRYGDKGPLPGGLTREQKMNAYEARYVHSGGRKAEKWNRSANRAEVTRNVGLAGATTTAAGALASRVPGVRRAAGRVRHLPGVRRVHVAARGRNVAETAGLAAGVTGGGGELYGEYARHKRSSYASAPGGVAASALRRMRDYTP